MGMEWSRKTRCYAAAGAAFFVLMVAFFAWPSTPHVFAKTSEDQSLEFVLDGLSVDPKRVEDHERVKASMAETSKYCADLGEEQSIWCEHMMNRDLLSEWNSYKKGRREHCRWSETNDFELFYSKTTEDEYYNMTTKPGHPLYDVTVSSWISSIRGDMWPLPNYEPRSPLTKDHDKVKQSCSFEAERGTWHVDRVGPFREREVGSWHYAWFRPFEHLDIDLPKTVGKYQVATLTSLANEKGEVIGYPPAHMHHFHVWNVNPLLPIWPHVVFDGFETHGDDMCDQSGLGSVCYMKSWPPGYGTPVPPRYFFEALANFVAPSEEQDFYFEISVLISDDPNTKATVPFVPHAPDMLSKTPQQAGTYEVPKDAESMVWGYNEAPFDLEVVWWKFHTHYYFTSEAWILSGDTSSLGLDKDPFVLYLEPFEKSDWQDHDTPKVADVFDSAAEMIEERFPIPGANVPYKQRYLDLGTVGLDHESAQQLLLERIKKHNDRVQRHDLDKCPECIRFVWRVEDVMDFHVQVDGKKWTRRPFTPPTKTRYNKGDKLTTIVFHKRNPELCGDTCEESKQPARLHFLVDSLTVPLDPAVSFFSSTTGTWFVYYMNYRSGTVAFIVGCILTVLVALLTFCYSRYCRTSKVVEEPIYEKIDEENKPFIGDDMEETKEQPTVAAFEAGRRRRVPA